jgi:alpha-beta hydrolase superfamily lysophospholipase
MPAGHREAILLLHGFGALPLQTALLARRLRAAGYTVVTPFYPSWRWPLARIADHLAPRLTALATSHDTVHCIGHSMGGLVLRALLARHRPANLGRVVMLGTPNQGSEFADLLCRLRLHAPILNQARPALCTVRPADLAALLGPVDYPLGIIAGDRPTTPFLTDPIFRQPHDGKVSVAATHLEGESDHIILPVGHTAMLYAAPVADQLIRFLQTGAFAHATVPHTPPLAAQAMDMRDK